MLNNEAAFLAALEANEDDEPTRRIFADWLEEHGRYEEAQRQRQWTGAKAWLVRLLDENAGDFVEDDAEELDEEELYDQVYSPTFHEFCELAKEALEQSAGHEEECVIPCYNNSGLAEALQDEAAQFWRNWSIVTGIEVPADLVERTYFGCAC